MSLMDSLTHYSVSLVELVEVVGLVHRVIQVSLVVESLEVVVLSKLVVFEVLEAVAVYNLEVPGLVAYH